MRLPGRLWFRDYVGGVEWQHRLVSSEVIVRKGGQNCYAYTDEADRTVYYYEGESDSSLGVLYFHELFHRAGLIPGQLHQLEKIYGVETFDDREELAAGHYGGVLWETLRSLVRLPKPPRKQRAA